ncbi:MAG: YtxH domain-containing protein [Candidatus Bathyarchaeia archaeon]
MSIKEEGYLHDYIAAGIIGFAVGMAIGGAAGLFFAVDWGRITAQMFIFGLFGYFPGGFVAGYVNFRLHKTDDKKMDSLTVGVLTVIIHLFITLFMSIFITAIYSGNLGASMGQWALSLLFAVIFYPLGAYCAAIMEERTIPIPAFLKFRFVPAVPPPPPPGAEICPTCGGPLTYISQYQRWYCYKCKKYA